MQPLLKLWQDRRWRRLVWLLLLALLIWYGGPYVAIANHSFLANINHRLLLLLILVLAWGVSNLRPATLKSISAAATPTDAITLASIQLQHTLSTTLQVIKKTLTRPFSWLRKPPCYLVLGGNQSGKTSLLSRATRPPTTVLVENSYYDCWLVNGAVFWDYKGNHHLGHQAVDASLLWQTFLQGLRRYRARLALRGILITVNIAQLLEPNAPIELNKIKQQLQQATTTFTALPVYLIFTHCDLIAGFTDFFEDLTSEERLQIFGFSLKNNLTAAQTAENFTVQFNQLLQQLGKRLIWRLQQEHNLQKRANIKDFPLQLQNIQHPLLAIINQFNHLANIKLMGSYFTSSLQQGIPFNFLTRQIESSFKLKVAAAQAISQDKSYFIPELFHQVTLKRNSVMQLLQAKKSYVVYSAAILLLLTTSIFWYQNYRENIAAMQTLQTALHNTTATTTTNADYPFLPTLTVLSSALTTLQQHHSFWHYFGLRHAEQVQLTAQQAYQKMLTNQFLPALQKILVTALLNDSAQNTNELYGTLKTYLMLSDLSHRDPQFMQQWFSNYWQQHLVTDPTLQKQLLTQLDAMLQQSLLITPQQQIVHTARSVLNQLSPLQLSYAVLINQYPQTLTLFTPNNAVLLKDNYTISTLYTAAQFNDVFNVEISKAVQTVADGNWVLGEKQLTTTHPADAQLVTQMQSLYLNQYANAWLTLLQKISLSEQKNLLQINQTLKILNSHDSPLWQLLNVIHDNTALNTQIPAFNAAISNQLQNLNAFTQNAAVTKLKKSLIDLQHYIGNISTADNSEKAAFTAASKRMQNNGNNDALATFWQQLSDLPTPLQLWLQPLPVNSWHFMLNDTHDYINQIWDSTVIASYNANLNNKYPLFKNANSDTSLKDFSNFFAPNGVLNNFFDTYLKAFVDTSHVYWVWKTIDNDHLPIPQTNLEMFIRAALIQKMFFSQNTEQPLVKFALIPVALEPGVIDFKLDLEGQQISYQPNRPPMVTELVWPGSNPGTVTLQFTSTRGKQAAQTETGPWAWFKVLTKANLQATFNNPKQFKVVFDLNGDSIQYKLVSNDVVNPFIAGIIDVFRCPAQL